MNPNLDHYAHVESIVTIYTHTWIDRMGLGHWEIQTVFLDSQLNDEPVENDFLVTAVTECRWNYLQAKIKWSLPSAVRISDEDLEKTVVHELCHVALSPEQQLIDVKIGQVSQEEGGADADRITGLYSERMELATEQMARCLLRAWRDAGR